MDVLCTLVDYFIFTIIIIHTFIGREAVLVPEHCLSNLSYTAEADAEIFQGVSLIKIISLTQKFWVRCHSNTGWILSVCVVLGADCSLELGCSWQNWIFNQQIQRTQQIDGY